MTIIYTAAHQQHNPPYEIYDGVLEPYAETASRAEAIIAAIRAQNMGPIIAPKRFPLRYIHAVHHPQYTAFLRRRSRQLQGGAVLYPSYFMSDTYAPVTAGTYQASRAAADAALTGAELVLRGEKIVYSLCRPPGHHAAHHSMGGYCYFNNAAIAAAYLAEHGRVAVLDIDFHHGNGTQDAFYDRSDVLYVSLHADPAVKYPYITGYADERGRGAGLGFNHNYPLPLGTDDASYLRALDRAIGDIADFRPDFLVVSAGFDTFGQDPIGGFSLSSGVYRTIGRRIAALQLPSLLVQEGGYNIEHVGEIAATFLAGFAAR